jgi:hypothetical protein
MGARNSVVAPARQATKAGELIPCYQFLDSLTVLKFGLWIFVLLLTLGEAGDVEPEDVLASCLLDCVLQGLHRDLHLLRHQLRHLKS